MKAQLKILFASSLVLSCSAFAEEKSSWKASAELGFVSTSGNTETETLNAKASASTENDQWRHKGDVSLLRSSDQDSTTARKINLSGQSDYKLKKPSYLFVSVAYEDDKFSGYEYRLSESVGYGRRVMEQNDLTLDVEIGPGARQSKLTNGGTNSEGLIRAAARLDWKISDTSNFTEALTIDAGQDATITKSVTGLTSKIDGNLSMKLTFSYQNISDVPVGVDKTDTETAVTLVYTF